MAPFPASAEEISPSGRLNGGGQGIRIANHRMILSFTSDRCRPTPDTRCPQLTAGSGRSCRDYAIQLAHFDVIADTRHRPDCLRHRGVRTEHEAQPVRRTAAPQRVSCRRVLHRRGVGVRRKAFSQFGPAIGLPDWATRWFLVAGRRSAFRSGSRSPGSSSSRRRASSASATSSRTSRSRTTPAASSTSRSSACWRLPSCCW